VYAPETRQRERAVGNTNGECIRAANIIFRLSRSTTYLLFLHDGTCDEAGDYGIHKFLKGAPVSKINIPTSLLNMDT
jgi:hypothetical protein